MKFEAGRTPLTVRSVTSGGVAEFLGVEKGMRIVTLDGMDVSRLNYDVVQAEMESRYSVLPARAE
jgi:predicted metalloprotease with PDZ domain